MLELEVCIIMPGLFLDCYREIQIYIHKIFVSFGACARHANALPPSSPLVLEDLASFYRVLLFLFHQEKHPQSKSTDLLHVLRINIKQV